jgi:hypothetical protein
MQATEAPCHHSVLTATSSYPRRASSLATNLQRSTASGDASSIVTVTCPSRAQDLFSLPFLRQKITDLRIVPQAVVDRFGRHRRLLGVRVAPIRKPLQKVLMALS